MLGGLDNKKTNGFTKQLSGNVCKYKPFSKLFFLQQFLRNFFEANIFV